MKRKITIIFPVKPRTKKNHGQLVTLKTGKQLMLPSKNYLEFEKEIVKFIKANYMADVINEPINLKCLFYKDKNYRSDLVGYLQAIQDALVKAKVIEDDNTNIVRTTDGSMVLLDRENPRVEVYITFYEDENEENS